MKRRKGVSLVHNLDSLRLAIGTPGPGVSAQVAGNAAGFHGGKKLKYGKRERRSNRLQERQMREV